MGRQHRTASTEATDETLGADAPYLPLATGPVVKTDPDSEGDGAVPSTTAAQADLFSVLGHELRLRVLHRLVTNRDEEGFVEGMTYTELRNGVGATTEDGFSYHLQKLVGTLVRKYERDGQKLYAPTDTGYAVYRALASAVPLNCSDRRTLPVDADCVRCGGGLVTDLFVASEGVATVRCPDCGFAHTIQLLDPSVSERTVEAALQRASHRARQRVELCRQGVCRHCSGTVARRVYPTEELRAGVGEHLTHAVVGLCDQCDEMTVTSVGDLVRGHPEVVAFFHERGRDVESIPTWELDFAATDEYTTAVETDPPRLRVEVPCDGDVLPVTVDSEARVVAVGPPR